MLKFILYTSLLTVYGSDSWVTTQTALFLMSFIFGLFFMNDFFMNLMGFSLGIDSISWALIMLSLWISALAVNSSQSILNSNNFVKLFLSMNILLLVSLILTFCCMDYILFYVCFESSLIPTLILILGWGYQPERLQAGLYMLFYTLFASLPLLVSLLSLYSLSGTLTIGLASPNPSMNFIHSVWYICTVSAFIVKLPMFTVHLWLPKAHVEAPVAGSMILAGILLKLGGYGLIRILPMFPEINKEFIWVWTSIGLGGGVLVSLICLRQTDIKALIAYSSVAHMGLVLCGLMLSSNWGLSGAVTIMVGHGLCSSGLFCLANMTYERIGSRSLLISGGLLSLMPSMALWWFLLSAGNMAAPPTLNLLGEINLIISVVSWSLVSTVAVGMLSFFSAAYTLYLFSSSQHGKFYNSLFSSCSGKVREYLILLLHWLPLNALILKSGTLVYLT